MNENSVVSARFPKYEAVRHLCGEIEQIPFCSNREKYDKPLFVSLAHRIRNDYSRQADRIQGYDIKLPTCPINVWGNRKAGHAQNLHNCCGRYQLHQQLPVA